MKQNQKYNILYSKLKHTHILESIKLIRDMEQNKPIALTWNIPLEGKPYNVCYKYHA